MSQAIGEWVGTQQVYAAWTQAIGSVLAILTAIGVAWWQGHAAGAQDARREAARRAEMDTAARELQEATDAAFRGGFAAVDLALNVLDPHDPSTSNMEVTSVLHALWDASRVIKIFLRRKLEPKRIANLVEMQRVLDITADVLEDARRGPEGFPGKSPGQRTALKERVVNRTVSLVFSEFFQT